MRKKEKKNFAISCSHLRSHLLAVVSSTWHCWSLIVTTFYCNHHHHHHHLGVSLLTRNVKDYQGSCGRKKCLTPAAVKMSTLSWHISFSCLILAEGRKKLRSYWWKDPNDTKWDIVVETFNKANIVYCVCKLQTSGSKVWVVPFDCVKWWTVTEESEWRAKVSSCPVKPTGPILENHCL